MFEHHIIMLSMSILVSCSVKAVWIILIKDIYYVILMLLNFVAGGSSNRGSSIVLIRKAIIILILGLIAGVEECLDLLEVGLMLLAGADLGAFFCRSHGLLSESIRVWVG